MHRQVPRITQNNSYKIPKLGLDVSSLCKHDACRKSVLTALESGYRHINTAQPYKNEKAVGEAIRQSGIARKEIYLTTKIWPTSFGYKRAVRAIQRSLEDLEAEYIDLLLLHQPRGDYLDAWRALEDAVDAGLVYSIGISNFNEKHTRQILEVAQIKPVTSHIEVHPYCQRDRLKAFLKENNILTAALYPLGHGNKRLLSEPLLIGLSRNYNKTVAQIILRWHMQKGHIVSIKSTDDRHIKSNIDIFDFRLSPEDMTRIDALDKNKPYFNMPERLGSFLCRFADRV